MNPVVMALVLLGGWGLFAWSAHRRWKLMMAGAPIDRSDRASERFARVVRYGLAQVRMRRYKWAGIAHLIIFIGFGVLLLRTLVLWGRGFDPEFNLWILGTDNVLGKAYAFLKDTFAVLVILGSLVFVYYRAVVKLKRMTLSTEGLVILGIIITMMLSDIFYDGSSMVKKSRTFEGLAFAITPREFPDEPNRYEVITFQDGIPTSTYRELTAEEQAALDAQALSFVGYEPAASVAAFTVAGLPNGALTFIQHAGFWTHSILVLVFLNLLPYSKHFHVITAIPNVYASDLSPPGRLPNLEDIEGKLEREETLGIKKIDQFSWKAILDFYTCTECGRCSDHCPATKTGKKLSPKHFTLDLRDFLYEHEDDLVAAKANGAAGAGENGEPKEFEKDLVDGVIDPEVLWACTTCRACEQECPVFISYVDKIVDMRRYLAQERGEFPQELQSAFRGLETNANPWSFPSTDRDAWAQGLDIKTLAEHPEAEVLFWVGCAPSFDERAKSVTVATAKLMKQAGVDFAILGQEEQCTGDPARRAGNEYLFQMFAQANVEVLNGYEVGKKTIVTSCPHCFNTLLNEYPDFGGNFDVVHHTTFLAKLVSDGRLKPTARVEKKIAYHDSCYLGRYNEVYDDPRNALSSIPGVTLVEPVETRDRGMCCGAGGAQMFKEEEAGDERVNERRTKQLLATAPQAIASACPFCQRMLTDGLAGEDREDIEQLDVAEVLLMSCEANKGR